LEPTVCFETWSDKIRALKVGPYRCSETLAYKMQAYEDGTYRVFRNVGI
jgi:hypothetical protein